MEKDFIFFHSKMEGKTYFQLIIPEIIELIVAKLDYESEENFGASHTGYTPEDVIYYDSLNVMKLKFPYLFKILKLKRETYTDERGFTYDANADTYEDYLRLSRNEELNDFFITGSITPGLRAHIFILIEENQYDARLLQPIFYDISRRTYPDIYSILNSLNLRDIDPKDFAVMLETTLNDGGLLSGLVLYKNYNILHIGMDIEQLEEEIYHIGKEYKSVAGGQNSARVISALLLVVLRLQEMTRRDIRIPQEFLDLVAEHERYAKNEEQYEIEIRNRLQLGVPIQLPTLML